MDVNTRALVGRVPGGRRQRRHPSRRARLRCPAPSTPSSRRDSSVPQPPTCASSCFDDKLFGTRPVRLSVRSSSSLLVPRKGCHLTPPSGGDEPDLADSGGSTCQDRSSASRLNLPQGLCLSLGAHSRRRKARKSIGSFYCRVLCCKRVNQFVENQAPSFGFDNGSSRLPCSACLLSSSFTVTSTARASVFEVADATGTSRT